MVTDGGQLATSPGADLMDPFWAAARLGRLTAQRCTSCADLRFPPLPVCPRCIDAQQEWAEVSPRGTVWSYVTYHAPLHPDFRDDVPYMVAIVETDDGVRYVGRLVGDRREARVGIEVTVRFARRSSVLTIPEWVIAA